MTLFFLKSGLCLLTIYLFLNSTSVTLAAIAPNHFTVNETNTDGTKAYSQSSAVGFNVHDTGMSTSTINSLPTGSKAMVWVGIGASNCSSILTSTFTNFVLANANNPNLFGFYLTDEPTDSTCVDAVKAYTNYIHTNAPGKKAFIVLTDWPGTYSAYKPSVTNVDLIGIDPYPVQDGLYDSTHIPNEINAAVTAGIPIANMVPVYQTFGGAGWDSPTSTQLRSIIDQFSLIIPNPELDYAYSWGLQGGYLTESLENRSDWRSVMLAHNSNIQITPSPTPVNLVGDINGDNIINILDYTLLANSFGTNSSASDLNHDGIVNILDFTILANNFGSTN